MGIRRIAVAGAVSGVALIGAAAPATAATAPNPPKAGPDDQPVGPPRIKASPNPFQPGDNLNLQVTGCTEEPRATGPRNEIFVKGEPASFDEEGPGVWSAIASTRTDLKPGGTYETQFFCVTPKGPAGFSLKTTVPGRPKPPAEPPDDDGPGRPPADPGFRFDHGDVTLTTRRAEPGRTVGIVVTCPSSVRAYSASFASQPRMEWIKKGRWEGVGRYKTHLPSIVRLTVECVGYGKVSFSTQPGRPDVDDGGPAIPRGAPDTGAGGTALPTAGPAGPLAGAALVALTGAGMALRRRAAREER